MTKRSSGKHCQIDALGCLVCVRRTMVVHVTPQARRSVLVDLLTVHALGGKAIVFTQTKREADEVAASVSLVHPCEVSRWVYL